jgi:hypothetical protein
MWWWTTTPPTSASGSRPGWRPILASNLHFTPTYGSWLNLVEVFFAIIERQALRRGDFATVQELIAAIDRFCDGWNQRCQPFRWTKDADQILNVRPAHRAFSCRSTRDRRAVRARITLARGQPQGRSGSGAGVLDQGGGRSASPGRHGRRRGHQAGTARR